MTNKELYNKLLEKGVLKVWLTEMEFLASDQMEYRKNHFVVLKKTGT